MWLTTYQHQLTPVSGIHYIQAWARDGAGNISIFPFQCGLNIEVYGYGAAEYQLQISVGLRAACWSRVAGGVDPAKPEPEKPVVPLDDRPPLNVGGDPVSLPTVYLPLISKP